MTKELKKQKSIWLLTPVFGTLLFVWLYFISTLFYPGGSQVDTNSVGFSWANNYWCNLLGDNAINGQHNPAKPIAITGMFVLCFSLSIFWFLFPRQINIGKLPGLLVQFSGIFAMVIALFLFTNIDHDIVINFASFFGLVASTGTFIGIYKKKWFALLAFGILNLLFVALNNLFYYHKQLIIYLPVMQKISFAAFLIWICLINIRLFKTQNLKI